MPSSKTDTLVGAISSSFAEALPPSLFSFSVAVAVGVEGSSASVSFSPLGLVAGPDSAGKLSVAFLSSLPLVMGSALANSWSGSSHQVVELVCVCEEERRG